LLSKRPDKRKDAWFSIRNIDDSKDADTFKEMREKIYLWWLWIAFRTFLDKNKFGNEERLSSFTKGQSGIKVGIGTEKGSQTLVWI